MKVSHYLPCHRKLLCVDCFVFIILDLLSPNYAVKADDVALGTGHKVQGWGGGGGGG